MCIGDDIMLQNNASKMKNIYKIEAVYLVDFKSTGWSETIISPKSAIALYFKNVSSQRGSHILHCNISLFHLVLKLLTNWLHLQRQNCSKWFESVAWLFAAARGKTLLRCRRQICKTHGLVIMWRDCNDTILNTE